MPTVGNDPDPLSTSLLNVDRAKDMVAYYR